MALFALSLILSSFLLFQIQPLIGKYILPWFGSSPSVWSASLLFFQSLLTAGYAYTYTLANRISYWKQVWIHFILVGLTLLSVFLGVYFWNLPLLPDESWQPDPHGNSILEVVAVLFVAVGLPYFLLASNSTLLQSWFTHLYPARSPYRLYALSNAASLIGLLSYPFLFEPLFPISSQAWWWFGGFLLFLLTIGIIGWRLIAVTNPAAAKVISVKVGDPVSTKYPDLNTRILWIILPATASLLLLATTNQMTQEVAVVPFLWVLPLSLYLLSFILSFESDRWYGRGRFVILLVAAAGVYGLMLSKGPLVDLRIQIASYCLLLFVCAMVCHGELAGTRPAPEHLTGYYLSISIGGTVGGVFVNLIAPLIFKDYWELPLGLFVCFALYLYIFMLKRKENKRWFNGFAALALITTMTWMGRFSIEEMKGLLRDSNWIERNFFGVLRVREIIVPENNALAYRLIHGITVHGLQFKDAELRRLPTTYYSEASGVGLAFRYHPNLPHPLKVAVLGLGTGTLAVYGRSGDDFRFYEINPAVVRVARGEGGYFSFLKDSAARIEIIMGDARLSLERELRTEGSGDYDLIVIDTFSSDSIPVHLITREAFGLYLAHLKPDGILAVHISNIHLNLEPVVLKIAEHFDLESGLVASGRNGPGTSPAVWVLLTKNKNFFEQDEINEFIEKLKGTDPDFRLWTDDYSNLFQILR